MVAAEFPAVRLIANTENRGFTGGNNQGLALARGRYIFFLNPDTEVVGDALATMLAYMDAHPEVGALGPQLLYGDGSLQSSRRRFPSFATALFESTPLAWHWPANPWARRYRMEDQESGVRGQGSAGRGQDEGAADSLASIGQEVDWLVGAALLARRAVLEQIGGFDEAYFMYSEELDWCRRAKDAGWQIVYLPTARVIHYEGKSSEQVVAARHIRFQTSKVRYFRKFHGPLQAQVLRVFILALFAVEWLLEAAKWVLGSKRPLRRERLAAYGQLLASGLDYWDREHLMRILFITGEYPAMQGGVGDYTRRLSQALGALGADVHVLTHADAGGDHLRVPAAAYEPTVYPVMGRSGWNLWDHTLRLIRELHPDVVHIQYQSAAYDLHPAVNYLPWRLRLLRPRPRILTTFHDLRFPYLFPKAGPLRWQTVLALARGSDASVITNPADWLGLANAGLAAKLRPIPIGSNIECQPPVDCDRACQRAQWGAGPDTWLLAYFGFLNAGKGGETLVRTLAELVRAGRPARLLMVGGQVGASDPTNLAYLEKVKKLIVELGVGDRVSWTGFTANDQVSANLLASDCAVLPYREGATLRHGSLMAAMAHGLPIVSTQTAVDVASVQGRFPMLSDGESALLVPPEDPARLAEAVTAIMTAPDLRTRLGSASLALSKHFEWAAIARRHLDAYHGLGLKT